LPTLQGCWNRSPDLRAWRRFRGRRLICAPAHTRNRRGLSVALQTWPKYAGAAPHDEFRRRADESRRSAWRQGLLLRTVERQVGNKPQCACSASGRGGCHPKSVQLTALPSDRRRNTMSSRQKDTQPGWGPDLQPRERLGHRKATAILGTACRFLSSGAASHLWLEQLFGRFADQGS
jgi:hypothetical protein